MDLTVCIYAFQGYRYGKYIQVYYTVMTWKSSAHKNSVHTQTLHLILTMWDPHPVCFFHGGSTVSSEDYRCKPQPRVNCLRVEMLTLASIVVFML